MEPHRGASRSGLQARGDHTRAAAHLREALVLGRETGTPGWLGEAAFRAAWAEGSALPLDEAVALALEDTDAALHGQ
jgi:hypothetical protein